MKRILITLAIAASCCGAAVAQTSMRMSPKEQVCEKWIERNFSKSAVPPFSFTYDGEPSGLFLKKWSFSKGEPSRQEDGVTQRSFFWTDRGSGLQVECKVKTFNDFNAMEWVLYFRNLSDADNSGRIADVKAADINLKSTKDGNWSLFYAKGSEIGRAHV